MEKENKTGRVINYIQILCIGFLLSILVYHTYFAEDLRNFMQLIKENGLLFYIPIIIYISLYSFEREYKHFPLMFLIALLLFVLFNPILLVLIFIAFLLIDAFF